MIQDIFPEGFMRTYLIRAALALGVVLAVSGSAAAQSIVRGTVVDAEGNPIEGATVTIEAAEANRRAEITTNDNGEFTQIGLASGPYNVTVTKDDLRDVRQVNITQGAPTELDFQLTPTSGMTEEQIESQRARLVLVEGALEAMRSGQDGEAIRLFNEMIVEVPTCSDCYYNLGVAHSNLAQYAEAEASFQRAIEMEPTSAAYTGLANVYNAQQKFDLAAEAGASASELGGSGNNAEALYNQGVILWNAGNFAEAKEQFQAAVESDPSMAMAHYQLGMANLNLGQIPEARQAFEGYLEADPDGPKAGEVKVFVEQLPQ